MELRAFADRAVDVICLLVSIERIDVGLRRRGEDLGRVWMPAKKELAADDDELVLVGDNARRANDVLEILPLHCDSPSDSSSGTSPITTPFLSA